MADPDASSAKPDGAGRHAVLLPYPFPGPFDYRAPAGLEAGPGDYVAAPLGTREVLGVVWGAGTGDVAESKLKPISERFDVPPMPEAHRRFIDWVAAYTLSPPGTVLRMSLTAPRALEPPRASVAFRLGKVP